MKKDLSKLGYDDIKEFENDFVYNKDRCREKLLHSCFNMFYAAYCDINIPDRNELNAIAINMSKHSINLDELELNCVSMQYLINFATHDMNYEHMIPISESEWLTSIISQVAYPNLPRSYFIELGFQGRLEFESVCKTLNILIPVPMPIRLTQVLVPPIITPIVHRQTTIIPIFVPLPGMKDTRHVTNPTPQMPIVKHTTQTYFQRPYDIETYSNDYTKAGDEAVVDEDNYEHEDDYLYEHDDGDDYMHNHYHNCERGCRCGGHREAETPTCTDPIVHRRILTPTQIVKALEEFDAAMHKPLDELALLPNDKIVPLEDLRKYMYHNSTLITPIVIQLNNQLKPKVNLQTAEVIETPHRYTILRNNTLKPGHYLTEYQEMTNYLICANPLRCVGKFPFEIRKHDEFPSNYEDSLIPLTNDEIVKLKDIGVKYVFKDAITTTPPTYNLQTGLKIGYSLCKLLGMGNCLLRIDTRTCVGKFPFECDTIKFHLNYENELVPLNDDDIAKLKEINVKYKFREFISQ